MMLIHGRHYRIYIDPSVQAKLLKMLMDLQTDKGLTMLFITHDIGLARKIADRIGVMLDGRIVEIGPAARLIEYPAHPYTRRLIAGAKGLQEERPVFLGRIESGACSFSRRCDRFQVGCCLDLPGPVNLDDGRHLVWCRRPLSGAYTHTLRSKA